MRRKSEFVVTGNENMIRLFISHSSKDKQLAEKLVELLKNALRLASQEIRCTTVDGYRLPGGAKTSDQLKREVRESDAFIGLISTAVADSMYVLFELGARWGSNRHLLPLLANGVSSDILKGPLSELNALSCDNTAQLHQLVQDIANILEIDPENPAVYQRYINEILAVPPALDGMSSGHDEAEAPSSAASPQGPTCPNCSTAGRPFYMAPIPREFVMFENATHECSKCKYKTRIE